MHKLKDIGIVPDPDFGQLRKTLLREGAADYVPFYELYVNNESMEAVLEKKIESRADTVEFYYKAGYDYVPAWPLIDLKGGNLANSSSGYPISDRKDFENHPWPNKDSVSFAEFESVIPILPEGMKIIGQRGGVFECLEKLLGYEGMCFMLADDRELIKDILDKVEEIYVAAYTGMAQMKQVGALVVSDDMGFKTQTLISPDDLRKFILPIHKKLADIAHEHGKPCILHSCGQLKDIMDDIIDDVGVDAKHSFEDSIIPVTEAKELYGNRIAILGGFDVDRLCRSSVDEVREYTSLLLEKCGADGGYALGSGNSIAGYVPPENYLAMLDEGWNNRK